MRAKAPYSSKIGFARRVTLGLIALFLLLATSAVRIYGAPGSPGTPQDPTIIFEEDFQNRTVNSNILLTDYTGTTGMTYTADPYWLSRDNCNGFIVDFGSPYNPGDCDAFTPPFAEGQYNNMLTLTYALGLHNNADPETFPAVSAYSEGDGPANAIQFETDGKIPLPSGSNFVSFSVDVSAVNCVEPVQPLLRFYLVDENDNATPISDTPINPCTDGGSTDLTVPNPNGGTSEVRVGTFVADGSMLFSGNELGIVMRNEEGQGFGNDSAYTNIRVLNVSPQLDKTFAQSSDYVPGSDIPVTFTITNTSELAAKEGWSFTDNLPAGLVVADNPNVSSTCTNSNVNAIARASSFTVGGDLDSGQESCQVTLSLTATTAGTFTNGPENISVAGLNPPGQATVTVNEGLAATGQNIQVIAVMLIGIGLATVGIRHYAHKIT